ncbi:hypothetical protein [Romboutsia timonensis]|uniref:hypothetical protein n=1 Tax=Romboutsia timonensis TaxID=1776391 RepID=UPI003992288B
MSLYTLRDLVSEITGIDKDSPLFETTEKKIRYINKYLKNIINISEIESCIDKKDVYVKLSKAIYTDDNLYKIVRKIIQKKNVEYEEKIELFREIREAYGEDGFREYIIKFKEYIITEQLVEKLNEITESINTVIKISTEFEQDKDVRVMKNLSKDIQNVINNYRAMLQISKIKDELYIETGINDRNLTIEDILEIILNSKKIYDDEDMYDDEDLYYDEDICNDEFYKKTYCTIENNDLEINF